jgi:hypothetical protein
VDRDGSGRSPPGESSSFDLAKMTEADVAAEIAQRMARWRRANTRPAATERGPPPGPTAAPAAAPPSGPPVPALAVADRPSPAAPGLEVAKAVRLDRALRIAAGALDRPGPDPESLPREALDANAAARPGLESRILHALRRARAIGLSAWRAPAHWPVIANAAAAARPGLESRILHALRHARAIGLSAWQAPAHWPAIAGAALLVIAVAGWFLMSRDQTAVPEVARQVEAPPPIPAVATKPVPPPEALAPEKAAAPMPAILKPAWRGPALVARLKPTTPAAAPAVSKPTPAPPQAAPPVAKPRTQAQNIQGQEPADETRKRPADDIGADDIEGLDRMFSDGLGHRLPRRRRRRDREARSRIHHASVRLSPAKIATGCVR